jgi:formylglycine-generating enzyme required for sulfatase activity
MRREFLLCAIVIMVSFVCGNAKPPGSSHHFHAPKCIILSSPDDGAMHEADAITLAWKLSANAKSYCIQVSKAKSFATTILSLTGISSTQNRVTQLAGGSIYYWRVRMVTKNGNGRWSDIWSFVQTGADIGLHMIRIPAGTFYMGNINSTIFKPYKVKPENSYKEPVHKVALSSFEISTTLITQGQYSAVIGYNPSYFDSGSEWPVEKVSWYDAALFCNKLSKMSGLDTVYSYFYYQAGDQETAFGINYHKNGYRLPTEAEYEYACRAGTTTDYYWGRNYPPKTHDDTLAIEENAVWSHNSPESTQPVGAKKPNAWGLFDMAGNVWEWCNDCNGDYNAYFQTNPSGPATGNARMARGGSWSDCDEWNAYWLCAANRSESFQNISYEHTGFRVVRGVR